MELVMIRTNIEDDMEDTMDDSWMALIMI
jgi:hypothetical protein